MKIKILLATWLISGMFSCKKWLDVKPATQLPESEVFANEQGFKDLMTGVYTRAAGRSLYGEKLTISFMDVIARRYSNTTGSIYHSYYYSAYHDYSNATVQGYISNIWSDMYAGVAQINLLLRNVDNKKSVFSTEAAYKAMKGQAMGMRAFFHFDLLRMFAPAYTVSTDTKAIPYVKDFTVSTSASLSTAAVIDSCISDLKAAETLLQSDTTIGDRYWFNIWAVRTTLARAYLYKNDSANAFAYAKRVIDSKVLRFVNATEVNSTTPDRVFPTECVFSLSDYYLNQVTETFFTETANGAVSPNFTYLLVPEATIKTNYENAVLGFGGDPRYKLWWQLATGASTRFLSKYWKVGATNQFRMPVMRLGELHLIAAETAPDLATAQTYLDGLRVTGRFLPAFTGTTTAQLQTEIAKEYVKEFFGEGQLFYYYKRKNQQVPGARATGNALFVFPIPQNEIEFRF